MIVLWWTSTIIDHLRSSGAQLSSSETPSPRENKTGKTLTRGISYYLVSTSFNWHWFRSSESPGGGAGATQRLILSPNVYGLAVMMFSRLCSHSSNECSSAVCQTWHELWCGVSWRDFRITLYKITATANQSLPILRNVTYRSGGRWLSALVTWAEPESAQRQKRNESGQVSSLLAPSRWTEQQPHHTHTHTAQPKPGYTTVHAPHCLVAPPLAAYLLSRFT